MSEGWIKLHRSITKWEWYDDQNTFRLFLHCLLRANFQDTNWRGQEIKRGEFVCSYQTLKKDIGLSVQSIRTSINRLKSTGELTVKRHPKYSIISITNYDLYQADNSQTNSQPTGFQQGANRLLTTDKNVKNNKNEKNVKKTPPKSPSGGMSAHHQLFDKFWSAYPVKKAKAQAEKTWLKINPDHALVNTMISAIENQKGERMVLQDRNEFVPQWKNPSTWLNARCWEDEPSELAMDIQRDNDQIEKFLKGEKTDNVIHGDFRW